MERSRTPTPLIQNAHASRHAGVLNTYPGALRCLQIPLGRPRMYCTISGAGWEPRTHIALGRVQFTLGTEFS